MLLFMESNALSYFCKFALFQALQVCVCVFFTQKCLMQ